MTIEQEIKSSDGSPSNNNVSIFGPILLIGALSMLFAEVFSGASQAWFISGWGILGTYPLYLAHVLFFLWIALKLKKTSLSQLYLFGVIFALYESWITKVLWAGYIDQGNQLSISFLGLGVAEFPVLVFFWHPIMSFILPILVFEILTGKILAGHESVLRKSTKKTTLIVLFLILISTFIAYGNKLNSVSANLSLIGTLVIISGLFYLAKKSNIKVFEFSKTGFTVVTIYLLFLYITAFFLLLPVRIPKTIMPYASIIVFYFFVIFLISKLKKIEAEFVVLNDNQYSIKDIIFFAIVTILSVNVACVLSNISSLIFIATYIGLIFLGTTIFVKVVYKTLKQDFAKNVV